MWEVVVGLGAGGRSEPRSLREVAERRRERRAPPAPALILRLLPHGSHMERRGGIGDDLLRER